MGTMSAVRTRFALCIMLSTVILLVLVIVSGSQTLANISGGDQLTSPFTVAVATDCTLYASATGNDTNTGTSSSSPVTLRGAVNGTQPGSVVCLLPGTYAVSTPFDFTHSGTRSAWIVYRSYDPTNPAVLTPASGTYSLLRIPLNVRYIEIRGLRLDGKDVANGGVSCNGGDHLRIVNNVIRNVGSSGIATYPDPGGQGCDYLFINNNTIYHTGYDRGWSSGISLNQQRWYDQYRGFHSIVINNRISGQYDNSSYHSDGNGIIMDNPDGTAAARSTPPVLIANNVVYQSGGRCFNALNGNNYWIVNNTCYKNGLDLTVDAGEFVLNESSNNFLINNIAYAWNIRYPYYDTGSNNHYYRNLWFTSGTGTNHVPSAVSSDPSQLKKGDPLFVSPPYVGPSAGGQYANALDPVSLTNQFFLRASSPAMNAGIDPTTISGISTAIAADLKAYAYTDVKGTARPQGAFDLGAYESSTIAPTPTPQPPPTIKLNPVADTYVDSANPTTNYGMTNPLSIVGTPMRRISYFKFNLSTLAGKSITSAKLRLNIWDGSVGTHNLKAVADSSWSETGMTYNTRPALGTLIGSVTNLISGTWIVFDVTSFVRARLGLRISFAMATIAGDGLWLSSREVTFNKPQLVIR